MLTNDAITNLMDKYKATYNINTLTSVLWNSTYSIKLTIDRSSIDGYCDIINLNSPHYNRYIVSKNKYVLNIDLEDLYKGRKNHTTYIGRYPMILK